jgi:hypothetical protein
MINEKILVLKPTCSVMLKIKRFFLVYISGSQGDITAKVTIESLFE